MRVPCEANGEGGGMFREPAIIMPAALAEPIERGGEAHQRHEQHVGHQRLGVGGRLEDAEGADLQIVLRVRVGVVAEAHRGVRLREMGQGNGVPGVAEEAGVGGCGGLPWAGMIDADHRLRRNAREQRGRGSGLVAIRPEGSLE